MRIPSSMFPIAPLLLALTCALAPARVHAGPAGSWQRISTPPQSGANTVFDSDRQLLYFLGGDGTSIVHAVTVGAPLEWTNLAVSGPTPAPRIGATLAWDPAGDRLLMFGGQDYDGHFYNDVWELSLSGTRSWAQITVTGSVPDPRSGFAACFNASRRILVVSGGLDSLGQLLGNNLYQVDLGQPHPAWTEWSPDENTPTPRSGMVFCDDPSIDGLIAFGGNDGGSDLTDAYTMRYGTHSWTAIEASGDVPFPAAQALCTLDTDDHLLFVWGGSGSDDNMRTLDPGSGTWTIQPNNGWQSGPTGHTYPAGAWVSGGHRLQLVDGGDHAEVFEFFFTPPSTSYWQNWLDPAAAGELRSGCSFVLDRADDVAYLFGGDNEYGTPVATWWSYGLGSTRGWTNGLSWNMADDNTPGLVNHVAVWDQPRRRMLVFGGSDASYARHNDVYAMQDTMGFLYVWSQLAPAGTLPTPRFGAAAIYDPAGDRMLVFGGSDVSGWPRGDLWQLALSGTPTWTAIPRTGGPRGRYGHSAIYDAPKHRMIVFGGTDSLTGPDNEVWALSLPALTWTHLAPTGTAPPARYQHSAVFDSRRERMLVTGGTVASGDMRDVWELNLAGSTPAWTKLAPVVTVQGLPIGRYQHAAVYDSTGDRMLLYGGLVPPLGTFGNPWAVSDLWSLQFDFSNSTTGVAPAVGPLGFLVGEPGPNPSRGVTRLALTLGRGARVRADVYDLAGRRIAELANGERAAGTSALEWSGREASGASAAAGLYFCRVEVDGRPVTRRILRVR